MIGIYKVVNKSNGKIYIGQSINIANRWYKHRNNPFNPESKQYNSKFYRAIRKYGIDNFEFSVLEECAREALDERECYWIDYYKSYDSENGYNLTKGGQGSTGNFVKINEETLKEIQNFTVKYTNPPTRNS